ncbi:hypothetical protein JOQ06_022746 [Pogonophryne albipinna]|uniref:Uncharacterized protein n=1 Tax=Pogonophryne albipinna TaxID=1090488 RepID=A0AAD6A655_9TELE|nr:hypothetical protein JOQ06_022746 [Pogonophryne albipinna]
MKVKILRHKKDEVELAGSKRNDDVVVRVVEEEVEDSEGHSSDEGNMSDVWNGEREESGNEEQKVQRQKEKDLLFEREMRGEKEGKEKAATRARREELKGWKRISVDLGKFFIRLLTISVDQLSGASYLSAVSIDSRRIPFSPGFLARTSTSLATWIIPKPD